MTAKMHSKTSGNLPQKSKPWDYKRWGFEYINAIFDGTTKRFNENSKVVVVEGPPALTGWSHKEEGFLCWRRLTGIS